MVHSETGGALERHKEVKVTSESINHMNPIFPLASQQLLNANTPFPFHPDRSGGEEEFIHFTRQTVSEQEGEREE